MNYIKVSTGEYPLSEQDIKRRHRNISFPSPFSPPNGYEPIREVPPPQASHAQTVERGEPELVGGVYRETWVVTTASEVEMEERSVYKAQSVRDERDALLSKSDWTQLADSPNLSNVAWKTYRTALRNIPEQTGFPWNVEWPFSPEA